MNPTTNINVAVDPANPGQFFACCGLLEVADRLCPDVEGWFEDGHFSLACGRNLRSLLEALLGQEARAVTCLENGLEVKPIIAPLRIPLHPEGKIELYLDSWMRIVPEKGRPVVMGNPPWNFWSGQQTSLGIWNALREEMKEQLRQLGDDRLAKLFSQRVLLSGRFGFDPGAAWDALDAGFSPNAQGLAVASSPAVELLAAVGMQRFRPLMNSRQSFTYATWAVPLAAPVAACAAAASPIAPNLKTFQGHIVSRGQYGALGYSTPL